MYKITDIESLGTEYTVTDQAGKLLKKIRIIPESDILEAALGEYTEEDFGNFSNYLEKSVAVLSGFDKIMPYSTLWHSTFDEEVILSEVIEFALKNGYDRIVLEHLEDLE